jgi:hypothetical protein
MSDKIFTSTNIILFLASAGLLIVGYWFLGQGPVTNKYSMTVAPLLLVFVYCALIPVAIMFKDRKAPKDDQQQQKK